MKEIDDHDDAACAGDLKAGGKRRERAVNLLYDQYASPMRAFFRNHGLSPDQAEDCLQETFIKMLRGIKGYRAGGRFSAWFWSIARNEMRMHWRAAAHREEQTDPDDLTKLVEPDADGAANRQAIADCVRAALDRFAGRFRDQAEALRLIAVYEWSIDDVARYLNRRSGATREYLSQARKRLAPYLEPCRELLGEEHR